MKQPRTTMSQTTTIATTQTNTSQPQETPTAPAPVPPAGGPTPEDQVRAGLHTALQRNGGPPEGNHGGGGGPPGRGPLEEANQEADHPPLSPRFQYLPLLTFSPWEPYLESSAETGPKPLTLWKSCWDISDPTPELPDLTP